MAFGAMMTNQGNTTIIGEDIVPIVTTDTTRTVGSQTEDSWRWYDPERIDGHIAGFTMTSSMNQFYVHGARGDDGANYSVYSTERYIFNDNANLGNLTFSYVALGDVVTYPSGGWGIEVRNSSGNITFKSTGLILSPENIVHLNSGDTVTIANGKTVCPLMWHYAPSFQGAPVMGRIIRSGSSTTWTASKTNGQSGWCGSLIIY